MVSLGGKIGLLCVLYNFAFGLKTLKWIVLAPDLPIWKYRNPRRKPENGRNGHFSFLKGPGGKFQVRRFIFSLNALYYTPEHLCEVTQLNSNMTHYRYTLIQPQIHNYDLLHGPHIMVSPHMVQGLTNEGKNNAGLD